MVEKREKAATGPTRHVFRNAMLAYTILATVMISLQRLFNKSPVPGERLYDPAFGIILAFGGAGAFIAIAYYHFTRTDEHDRLSLFWAFSWGFLTYFVVAPAWRLLNQSGLAGPMNPQTAIGISVIVTCLVWAWHKFR